MSGQYADALERLAAIHFFQAHYAEAEPIYVQALSIRNRLGGPQHEAAFASIVTLGDLYRLSNRPQMGEPLLREGLAAREQATGVDDASLIDGLRAFAETELALHHDSAAEGHIRRALALSKKSKSNPMRSAQLLGIQAEIQRSQRHLDEAEISLQEALSFYDKARPTEANAQLAHVLALMQLARLDVERERFLDAKPLAERVLAISEKLLGPDHPAISGQLEAVASMYENVNRYEQAEALRRRAVMINERSYGKESANLASSLRGLGVLYGLQSRNEEALPLLLRALQIAEKALGPEDPALYTYRSDVGARYLAVKRYADAEPILKRALDNLEKGPNTDAFFFAVRRVSILRSLAYVYLSQGRYPDARSCLDLALALAEQAFGPQHSTTAGLLDALGMLMLTQDQTDAAERFFERALAIEEKVGKDDVGYAGSMAGLSMAHFNKGDWAKAYPAMKAASSVYVAVEQRLAAGATTRANTTLVQSVPHTTLFLAQAFTGYYLAAKDAAATEALRDEAFQMAQRAQGSEAAVALGQLAARFASGTGALATKVRERQDLGVELQGLGTRLAAALSVAPAARDPDRERTLRQQLDRVAARIDVLNAGIVREAPDYAALTNPQPLAIADVQKLLGPRESLVMIASQTHESLVWAIGKEAVQWALVQIGEEEIARDVAVLRCGLDYDGTWGLSTSSCADILKHSYSDSDRDAGKPLPFDRDRAHALYAALFGQMDEVIRDKDLLIVTSGALARLPLQVLVTDKPAAEDGVEEYRRTAWLIKRHALTVMPSVTSLSVLRGPANNSPADRVMIGFGNPLLDGPDTG
jgi:tetratricopeptide (TPR) repeat protein